MTQTPNQQKIRNKTITAKQWADMLKDGDWINLGGPGSDPTVCIEALCEKLGDGKEQVKGIELWKVAAMLGAGFFKNFDLEGKYHVFHEDFILAPYRNARDKDGWKALDWKEWGWALGNSYKWARSFNKDKSKRAYDWGIQAVPKPEGNYVNASYGVNNFMITAKTCKKFVCEIRDDYAWCEGGRNHVLSIDDVDYFIEVDTTEPKYQWPAINEKAIKPSDVDTKIAENILTIMRDGDCIQVGIGNLPTAVVVALEKSNLRHLGVHSEMIGEYAFRLTEAGIMDNSRKQIDRGRCVWAYIMPVDRQRYFEWLHHNPYFAAYDINYVNNIVQLSQNDNMVAINNFAQMDLMGQDCCANVGGRSHSGVGGQFQFTLGCAMSKGGRSILAATSRDKKGRSRFLPVLDPGSSVDVPSQFVSYVATEYGIVNLMGCSGWEIAQKIISIAHPDDRETLEKGAHKLGLKPNHWMFSFNPDRRYPSADNQRDCRLPYTDLRVTANPISDMTD
jgi:acyl-CoA hydrolase